LKYQCCIFQKALIGIEDFWLMNEFETHPWKWHVPLDAKCLVIGTHPTHRKFWAFEFFYPNKRNFFWKILSAIAGQELQHKSGDDAVEERIQLLSSLKVGVTDMGLKIMRLEESSKDEMLSAIEFMDIDQILHEYPTITTILLTSSTGKVSARAWLQSYVAMRCATIEFKKGEKESKYQLTASPSPRYANQNRLEQMISIYRQAILTA